MRRDTNSQGGNVRVGRATQHRNGRWSDFDYAYAAAYAVPIILAAPFFWAPPLWVVKLMTLPGHRRTAFKGTRQDQASLTVSRGTNWIGAAANDNAVSDLGDQPNWRFRHDSQKTS